VSAVLDPDLAAAPEPAPAVETPVVEPKPDEAPPLSLELALHPDDALALRRRPEMARLHLGRARTCTLHMVWHDTPTGALAGQGLALAERRCGRVMRWQLERMRPAKDATWVPGTPPPLLEVAAEPGAMTHELAVPLLPLASLSGHVRDFSSGDPAQPVSVSIVEGLLRAVVGERRVCRVTLTGPPAAVETLALALAASIRLTVPPAALSAEAYATARTPPPPRHLGAPQLPPQLSVGDAFAYILAHLTDVLLHWAPAAAAGQTAEPVHQMRVAIRRLRSAISLFSRAVACPPVDALKSELKTISQALALTRDWDVFVSGTGRAVAEAFAADPAVLRLVGAAERQRVESYAALKALLDGPGFRRVGLVLASLAATRPWQCLPPPAEGDAMAARQAAALATPLAEYAGRMLSRRHDAVTATEGDLMTLPPAELHALRIKGKRLRYAAEFFAPLYAGKETDRFIARLAQLQEQLGLLNDGAVAAALMGRLASAGRQRGYAAGVVGGFVAASSAGARAELADTWRKFVRLRPFWR
jgi:CHAD domain-containing protein